MYDVFVLAHVFSFGAAFNGKPAEIKVESSGRIVYYIDGQKGYPLRDPQDACLIIAYY